MLNKKQTRQKILEMAKATRYHEFTQVHPDVFTHLEMLLEKEIATIIAYQPSKGKTIKPWK